MFNAKLFKRILPITLSLCMAVQSVPYTAYAAEVETETTYEETLNEEALNEEESGNSENAEEESGFGESNSSETSTATEEAKTKETITEEATEGKSTEEATVKETITRETESAIAETETTIEKTESVTEETEEITEETESATEETETTTEETETEIVLSKENKKLSEAIGEYDEKDRYGISIKCTPSSYGVKIVAREKNSSSDIDGIDGILITSSDSSEVNLKDYLKKSDIRYLKSITTLDEEKDVLYIPYDEIYSSYNSKSSFVFYKYEYDYYYTKEFIFNGLAANTSYRYFLVDFRTQKSEERSFTTAQAIDTSAVSFYEYDKSEGYIGGKVESYIQNDNDEIIEEYGVIVDGKEQILTPSKSDFKIFKEADGFEYYTFSNKISKNITINENGSTVTPYVKVRTGEGKGDITVVKGKDINLSRKSVESLSVKTEDFLVGASSISGTVELSPLCFDSDGLADYDFDLYVALVPDGEDFSTSNNRISAKATYSNAVQSEKYKYNIESELKENSKYNIFYAICYPDTDTLTNDKVVAVRKGASVTTRVSKDYTSEDFDAGLWKLISNGKDTVSTDYLLSITGINNTSDSEAVTSLKGIEYLENLRALSLEDDYVSDATPLLKCPKLETIDLKYNELTTLPDFSKMENLKTLNVYGNLLDEEIISKGNYVPVKCSFNYSEQRKDKMTCSVGDGKVYPTQYGGDTYGFKVVFSHVRYNICRNIDKGVYPKIRIEIAGQSEPIYEGRPVFSDEYYETIINYYHFYDYYIYTSISGLQLTPGEYNWIITLTDSKGYEYNFNQEVEVVNEVGGLQEVPDSILPSNLKEKLITSSAANKYNKTDTDGDGKISFSELATMSYLKISYDDIGALDTFDFLKYTTELKELYITDSYNDDSTVYNNFTDDTLSILGSYKKLEKLSLGNMKNITDMTPIANCSELSYLYIKDCDSLEKISPLGKLEKLDDLWFDSTKFSDEELFEFQFARGYEYEIIPGEQLFVGSDAIYKAMERDKGYYIGEVERYNKFLSKVKVSIDNSSIVSKSNDYVYKLYATAPGTANVTYSLGNISHTLKVTVKGDWDGGESAFGKAVSASDRMSFVESEGLLNANVSMSLKREDGSIWSISTRTPKKLLASGDYKKYASRIVYKADNKWGKDVLIARYDNTFYINNSDVLCYYVGTSFNNVKELMADVADFAETGYTEYNSNCYLLILKKDGSLWYMTNYNDYDATQTYDSTYKPTLRRVDTDVKAVYPHGYLKNDGSLYKIRKSTGEPQFTAANIVEVYENNTGLTLAKDNSGNWYSVNSSSALDIKGSLKDMLVSGYYDVTGWNYSYYDDERNCERKVIKYNDVQPIFILMDDGTLYKAFNVSENFYVPSFSKFDTGVSKITADYYVKNGKRYSYTKEEFDNNYKIGNGLYLKEEADGTSSLYINGALVLTKVAEYAYTNDCAYAIRLDNTLWQLDEGEYPTKIDLAALSDEKKPVTLTKLSNFKRYIDITKASDTKHTVTWNSIPHAVKYKLSTDEDSSEYNITVNGDVTSYTFENSTGDNYLEIRALDSTGSIIAQSVRFIYAFDYNTEPETEPTPYIPPEETVNPGGSDDTSNPDDGNDDDGNHGDEADDFEDADYQYYTKSKLTAKQTLALNTFYSDSTAKFQLSASEGLVTDVEIYGDDWEIDDFDKETGIVTISPQSGTINKTLTFGCMIDDLVWKEVTVTVKTENKKPSISFDLKSSTFNTNLYSDYAGNNSIGTTLTVIDNSTKKALVADGLTVSFDGSKASKMTVFTPNSGQLAKGDGTSSFFLNAPSATGTAYLLVKASNWNQSIALTHKVTVNSKKVTGKFDVSKVTLNTKYNEAKKVKFTCGAPYEKAEFEINSIKNGKDEYLVDGENTSKIDITKENDGILFSLASSDNSVAGKYTILITPKVNDIALKDVKVTVQVVNADSSATVSTKGKIDVLDRDNTSITATVKLKNINGVVTNAEFANTSMAEKFSLEVDDGKLIIKLKPEAKVTSAELKSGFSGNLNLTVQSDKGTEIPLQTSKEIKIKPTQSNVKVNVVPKSTVMYKSGNGYIRNIGFAVTKPVGATLETVSITPVKEKDATYGCFEISPNSSGGYDLRLTEKGRELKAKTYNVSVTLKFKGSVEKTQTAKIKVVVKK